MSKNRICAVMTAICLTLSSCAYSTVEYADPFVDVSGEMQEIPKSMFIIIETTNDWKVVYHKETKVMYVVSDGVENRGNFTLLVDENGNPLLYTEPYNTLGGLNP